MINQDLNILKNYFCIIDPIQYETFAKVKEEIMTENIKNTISSTILETINSTVGRNQMLDTGSGNVGSIIGNIASNILEESDLSNDSFKFYKFRINPQKMDVQRRKVINEKYTGAGFDLDTITEEMIGFNYTGTTGSLVPYNLFSSTVEPLMRELLSKTNLSGVIGSMNDNYIDIPQLSNNPKLSASYLKFLNLEQFWRYNNNDLMFIWEDNCYIGKFVDFSYSLTEKEPYQITWRFSIKVYPEFTYNLFTGYIDEKEYGKIQNIFNKRFKEVEIYSTDEKNPISENIPTEFASKQVPADEEDINWFSQILKLPYEKNRLLYTSYQNKNLDVDISKISPRTLANWYKANADIDIFEDSIGFNLKKGLVIDGTNSLTSKVVGTSVETEVIEVVEEILP